MLSLRLHGSLVVYTLIRQHHYVSKASACYLQSGASKAGNDSQQKFEQRKAEVVGESKENIKEAEQTLGAKASGSTGYNAVFIRSVCIMSTETLHVQQHCCVAALHKC